MNEDRLKAVESAVAQIEQFGKGSIMRLERLLRAQVEVIPTGSVARWPGVGGMPREDC